MTTITMDETTLSGLRRRRAAGEAIKSLAVEAGMSWQRLWGLLNTGPARPAPRPRTGAGPLTERYRPRSLDGVWGQEPVVRLLKRFAGGPYPTAFLFEGETGTGKTSAALALAEALGCDVDARPPEFGGVHTIASGEQTADTVRELTNRMWQSPLAGSGWKVVIVNEADRIARPAEVIWLDRLEALPARTVVVFTTNDPSRLSQRFLDRCTRLGFESDAERLRPAARQFAAAVWKVETGRKPDARVIDRVVAAAEVGGRLSFRRVVQELDVALAQET